MNLLVSIWCLFSMFMTPFSTTQEQLTVKVNGIINDQGNIVIGIYNTDGSFPKYFNVYQGQIIAAKKGSIVVSFTDLPEGKYAIALWHDENNNKKLDTNWVGIPHESYGFSNNVFGKFGPPSFDDAAFLIKSSETKMITINLK